VRHTKSFRLSWPGHVERMESDRTPKSLSNGELLEESAEGKDLGRGGSKM
jgi:hypothetical protein